MSTLHRTMFSVRSSRLSSRWRSGLIVMVLMFITAAVPAVVTADEPADGDWYLELSVPRDHPTGETTILAATLHTGEDKEAREAADLPRLLSFTQPTLSLVQRDPLSGRYLFRGKVSADWQGKTLRLPVRPVREDKQFSPVKITRKEGGFEFTDDGRKVLFYQQEPRSLDGRSKRANYVHPVYDLSGRVLTQDFPADHIHHRGVFWAWHQLHVGDQRAGDAWANEDFLTIVRAAEVVDAGPVFATLKIDAEWTSPLLKSDDNPDGAFVAETTWIRLYPRLAQMQFIDFTISLRALKDDVRIGGSEDKKGYSGFTVRVAPPESMTITDESGVLKKDGMHNRSRWADVSGSFGEGDGQSGMAILNHSSLPEFPPKWLLRHYGMQNVLWPGREPAPLSRKKPLTLRHRLMIHNGTAEETCLTEQQAWYANLP